jgi:hypothetical protein
MSSCGDFLVRRPPFVAATSPFGYAKRELVLSVTFLMPSKQQKAK